MSLIECIEKYKKRDQQALLEIINKFNPIIKKYNSKFFYDDIRTSLIIAIIEATQKINLENFKFEGQLVNYFSSAIKNAYIDEIKKSIQMNNRVYFCNDTYLENLAFEDSIEKIDSKMDFDILIKKLSPVQKWVLEQIFVHQRTEVEIAMVKKVSKQAICNIKNRALKNIAKESSSKI